MYTVLFTNTVEMTIYTWETVYCKQCVFLHVQESFVNKGDKSLRILVFNWDRVPVQSPKNFSGAFIHAKLTSQRLFFKWKQFVEKMVEGETSRIGERSTETISGDTSGGRRDLSNRYSAPVIGGQKIDVEKFDGKINFGMWRREVMDALIQIDLDVVLKNKRHLYDEEI